MLRAVEFELKIGTGASETNGPGLGPKPQTLNPGSAFYNKHPTVQGLILHMKIPFLSSSQHVLRLMGTTLRYPL